MKSLKWLFLIVFKLLKKHCEYIQFIRRHYVFFVTTLISSGSGFGPETLVLEVTLAPAVEGWQVEGALLWYCSWFFTDSLLNVKCLVTPTFVLIISAQLRPISAVFSSIQLSCNLSVNKITSHAMTFHLWNYKS